MGEGRLLSDHRLVFAQTELSLKKVALRETQQNLRRNRARVGIATKN
jgi:hypothetical protein